MVFYEILEYITRYFVYYPFIFLWKTINKIVLCNFPSEFEIKLYHFSIWVSLYLRLSFWIYGCMLWIHKCYLESKILLLNAKIKVFLYTNPFVSQKALVFLLREFTTTTRIWKFKRLIFTQKNFSASLLMISDIQKSRTHIWYNEFKTKKFHLTVRVFNL